MRLIEAFWHTLEPSPAEIEAEIEAKLAARKARRQINSQRSIKGHSTRIKNAVAKALSVFGDRYENNCFGHSAKGLQTERDRQKDAAR